LLTTESRDFGLAALLPVQWVQNSTADQQPCQSQLWEVIFASEVVEADNSVDSDAIHEHDNRGQHLNSQLVDEERTPLSVHSHEPGFFVLAADALQVHVDDLAPLEVLVEKGDHNVLGLSHERQELSLHDLLVRSVAQSAVSLFFLVLFFHLLDPLLAHRPHDAFGFLVAAEIIITQVAAALLFFLGLVLSVVVFILLLFGCYLGLVHGRFVFDGLLQDELLEQSCLQLLRGSWVFVRHFRDLSGI